MRLQEICDALDFSPHMSKHSFGCASLFAMFDFLRDRHAEVMFADNAAVYKYILHYLEGRLVWLERPHFCLCDDFFGRTLLTTVVQETHTNKELLKPIHFWLSQLKSEQHGLQVAHLCLNRKLPSELTIFILGFLK